MRWAEVSVGDPNFLALSEYWLLAVAQEAVYLIVYFLMSVKDALFGSRVQIKLNTVINYNNYRIY